MSKNRINLGKNLVLGKPLQLKGKVSQNKRMIPEAAFLVMCDTSINEL